MNTFEKLRRKAKKHLFLKLRQEYIKEKVRKYGDIIEKDDEITVIVKKENIEKNKAESFYEMLCNGINPTEESDTADLYKVNKRIHYVFDGIRFEKPLKIRGRFCDISFNGCEFTNGVYVFGVDNVKLQSNKFVNWTDYYGYGYDFFRIYAEKNVDIVDEAFVNNYVLKKYFPSKFGIKVTAESINISNSRIAAESNGSIELSSMKLNLKDTELDSKRIKICSSSIDSDHSFIQSDEKVVIYNKGNDAELDIILDEKRPQYIYYNNSLLAVPKEKMNLEVSPYSVYLQEKRAELVNTLSKIYGKCKVVQDQILEEKKSELENESLAKTLK